MIANVVRELAFAHFLLSCSGIIQETPIPNKQRAPITSQLPVNSSSASMHHTHSAIRNNSPLTSQFASAILSGQISGNDSILPRFNTSGSSNVKKCNSMTPLISPSARRLSNVVLSDCISDDVTAFMG